ncbi:hypothetical protein IJ182_03225 [bacterium]|nr:hypothetical protein [bacterium]
MIFDFLKKKQGCKHDRIPVDVDEAYCPDCGALVQNKWYLVRCGCCNIKRSAHNHYEEIIPDTKYCPNCGSTEFYIEELDKINFLNVHYAVYKKVVVEQKNLTTRQIWIEKDDEVLTEKKLIGTERK